LVTSTSLWVAAVLIVLMNLPFGFWRAGVPRFSRDWFVAVHAPVPLAVGLRIAMGLGWRLKFLPVLVFSYFLGQFLGGRARKRRSALTLSEDTHPPGSEAE
jgi:hypothetical protein